MRNQCHFLMLKEKMKSQSTDQLDFTSSAKAATTRSTTSTKSIIDTIKEETKGTGLTVDM